MRRFVMFLVLAVALAGALVVAPSQTEPAEAWVHDSPYTVDVLPGGVRDYSVSMNAACTQQYGWGASARFWSLWNAYSWYCQRNGVGLGGINVDRWCKSAYPGSYAVVNNPSWVYAWSCRKVPSWA
jgi:hypothetical protein